MNWTTVYIVGRADFREEVRKKLDHTELTFMPGYIGDSYDAKICYDLYWFEEGTYLREVKKAIGARLILRYRLRFYPSQEEFLNSQRCAKNDFTDDERTLLSHIRELSAQDCSV